MPPVQSADGWARRIQRSESHFCQRPMCQRLTRLERIAVFLKPLQTAPFHQHAN